MGGAAPPRVASVAVLPVLSQEADDRKVSPGGRIRDNLALAVIPTLLAWPLAPAAAFGTGVPLDRSYMYALERAFVTRQSFGPNLSFTYGPLGFLSQTHLFYAVPFALAVVALAVLLLGANSVVIGTVRGALPRGAPQWTTPIVAVLVAYLATLALTSPLARPIYLLDALVLALGFQLLDTNAPTIRRWWLATGALCAAAGLILPTLGIAVAGVAVVAVIARPACRSPALLYGIPAALVSFSVLWLAVGGSVGGVAGWLRNTAEISQGYTAAMSIRVPAYGWATYLAGLLIVVFGAAVLAAGRGRPHPIAIGRAAMAAVVVWLLLKEGFVRLDGHVMVFVLSLPFLAATLRAVRHRWISLAAVGACVVASFVAVGASGTTVVNPIAAVRHVGSLARTTLFAARRGKVEQRTREELQATFALPTSWLGQIGTQRVAVEPYETVVAWAYPSLHLAMLPTIQEYTAYTTGLDRRNAAFYTSTAAPPYVIAANGTTDDRDQAFDPPDTALALRCNYSVEATTTTWALLRHDPGRCAPSRPIGMVHRGFGDTISVPPVPPGQAVTASFSIQEPWWWKVADVALRPTEIHLLSNGHPPIRFLPGTASEPHLLSFPGGTGFWVVPRIDDLRIVVDRLGPTRTGVTVRFSTIPVRAANRA